MSCTHFVVLQCQHLTLQKLANLQVHLHRGRCQCSEQLLLYSMSLHQVSCDLITPACATTLAQQHLYNGKLAGVMHAQCPFSARLSVTTQHELSACYHLRLYAAMNVCTDYRHLTCTACFVQDLLLLSALSTWLLHVASA